MNDPRLNEFFKYKIGDELTTISKSIKAEYNILVVVGREIEECHGGVQLFYYCRVLHIDNTITRDLFKFAEIEVHILDRELQLDELFDLQEKIKDKQKRAEMKFMEKRMEDITNKVNKERK